MLCCVSVAYCKISATQYFQRTVVSIVSCRCTYCCLETSHGKITRHYSRYCTVAFCYVHKCELSWNCRWVGANEGRDISNTNYFWLHNISQLEPIQYRTDAVSHQYSVLKNLVKMLWACVTFKKIPLLQYYIKHWMCVLNQIRIYPEKYCEDRVYTIC